MQCDEKRPVCERCEKGPRECIYPLRPEPKDEKTESTATISESCDSTNSELVKFSSPSRKESSSGAQNEPFDPTQIDEKMVIESLISPPYPIEPLFTPVALIMSGLTPTTYSQALQSQHAPLSITESMLCIPQSISPHGTRSQPVQFFLQYHQETITEAHYLRWYDYSKLCTVIIFTLAETADALQHAMVAFSTLIYSIKVNHRAREMAFLYYSVALRQLRLLLDKPTLDMADCFAAVATALQLSSFDVLHYSKLADFSDFLETLQNVFDIFKELPALCSKSRIQYNYAQVLSAGPFSSGLCNSKITAASLQRTDYCFHDRGVRRMLGYDINLLSLNILIFPTTDAKREY
jgi:hypothetical protein